MKQPLESAKDVAQATGDAISKTANLFASTLIGIGKGVFKPIRDSLPTHTPPPGAAPGIEHYLKDDSVDVAVRISVVDYGKDFYDTRVSDSIQDVLQAPRKDGQLFRWINVDGLNPKVIDQVCKHFGVHPLTAEDILHPFQRPKVEFFSDHMLLIARQVQLLQDKLKNEQVSFLFFKETLITFQEVPGDVFDPVRRRLENPTGRFRTHQADYLFYALLDSIVDHLFPLLEGYGLALEDLEEQISRDPAPACQQRLFAMKRDLALQRRNLWPLRGVIDEIYRDESGLINGELQTFFRDIQDHTMQVIDLLETYRDTASGLNDLYQSSIGNKMNEIMKVLTIMASFFIPITFVAGVYGMNFEHIPELGWKHAYFGFWTVCIVVSAGLAFFFWRKGWIGGK